MPDVRGEVDQESRTLLLRILVATIWIPVQILLSLVFASGGIFIVLILGMVAGPFIGLYFLIRHLARGDQPAAEPQPDEDGRESADTTTPHGAPLSP